MENIKLLFNGFKNGFKEFGHFINDIVNFILLSLVFILGVGLVSIFAKFFKKNFLDMKPGGKTYWLNKKDRNKTMEDSLKPF